MVCKVKKIHQRTVVALQGFFRVLVERLLKKREGKEKEKRRKREGKEEERERRKGEEKRREGISATCLAYLW